MLSAIEDTTVAEETENTVVGRCMSDTGLKLWNIWDSKSRLGVPPSSPKSDFIFNFPIETLPSEFPNISELEVPIIREVGVKTSIEQLGDFFNCTDYKRNHLQFWFLDIVTDCLWRSQDDFRFPVDIQKRILEWVLYMFKLIRSPEVNFSRKNFFRAFTEIVLIVGEIIDEEQEDLPPPEQVFQLISNENSEDKSWASSVKEDDKETSGTFSGFKEKASGIRSVLEIHNIEEETNSCFLLPKKTFSFNEYKLSPPSTYTMTTERSQIASHVSSKKSSEKGWDRFESISEHKSSLSLVSPETGKKIKKRKVPLIPEENKSEIIEEDVSDEGKFDYPEKEEFDVVQMDEPFEVLTLSDFSRTPREEDTCPTSLFERKTLEHEEGEESEKAAKAPQRIIDDSGVEEELDDETIMKRIIFQQLWEQRLKDMEDSEKGWVPSSETASEEFEERGEEEEEEQDESEIEDKEDWFNFLDKAKKKTEEKYRRKLFNFLVMWAVINFVFDYFYNKFQFSLIALAFKATPIFITQRLNHVWRIPKINKEEALIPRDPKPKPKKEKKPKKGKKDKGKKGKKDKKDKKGKKEKPKKEKPVKLTKEQLKELERIRKEEERLALERLMVLEQELEQKRFMFPLRDGGTDEFYKSIFENWVKVDLDKIFGKKGKGKDKKKKKK